MEEVLVYFALKYEGDFNKILNALQNKERVSNVQRKEAINGLKCNYTTIISDNYPSYLREINCPPFVIFYKGSLKLLEEHNLINIIGDEANDSFGKNITEQITYNLIKDNDTIIVGNNNGIEKIAKDTTLEKNGKLVIVLNNGIENDDYLVDSTNENVLLISEYANNVTSTNRTRLFSRRIAVGLSDKILVTQTKLKSDPIVSVGYACDLGKDVYVIPNNIDSKYNGNNKLIQEVARTVTNLTDPFGD